jgi:hypothetical protein
MRRRLYKLSEKHEEKKTSENHEEKPEHREGQKSIFDF